MKIDAAAVFCGSRPGHDPAYLKAARDMGAGLARAGIELVYGGGNVGLMGAVADAALAEGGAVFGVIPGFLRDREVMHEGVAALQVTDGMHERKTRMFARAGAFLILPGGLGTFDELMEILTWRQLGLHDKPIVIVDVGGWAHAVTTVLQTAIAQGFAAETARGLCEVVPDVEAALRLLAGVDPGRQGALSRL